MKLFYKYLLNIVWVFIIIGIIPGGLIMFLISKIDPNGSHTSIQASYAGLIPIVSICSWIILISSLYFYF